MMTTAGICGWRRRMASQVSSRTWTSRLAVRLSGPGSVSLVPVTGGLVRS